MNQWKVIPVIVGILLMACTGYILAQTQQPSPPAGRATAQDPRMEQAIDRMFHEMDTNHDGKISKSEWMDFQEKQFNRLDKKGQGFITKDDVRADWTERMRAERQQMRRETPPQ